MSRGLHIRPSEEISHILAGNEDYAHTLYGPVHDTVTLTTMLLVVIMMSSLTSADDVFTQ